MIINKEDALRTTLSDPDEQAFSHLIGYLHAGITTGHLSEAAVQAFRHCLGDALSTKTLQGWAFHKPHGYPGDFQMLDYIYQGHRNGTPGYKEWDSFFQQCEAVLAVRNRKQFFKDLLHTLDAIDRQGDIRVLNVASGPGRDVAEYFEEVASSTIRLDCLDQDQKAIEHAQLLCEPFLDRLQFIERNAFRFDTQERYCLIWSAGLFDYLTDRQFMFLLKRLMSFLQPEGELVIGNFSPHNPSRAYMEIVGDWYLHHRDEQHLKQLATVCGISPDSIRITAEPEGVNLFLHIKRGSSFIPIQSTINHQRFPAK